MTSYPWKTVWIVGASSGLGLETAKQLAGKGLLVTISARSGDKLAKISAENKGISALPFDVSDFDACREAVHSFDVLPDLILLNAAIYSQMRVGNYDARKARQMMDVNYGGVCNMIELLMPPLMKRKKGHIAIVASINGFVGLPVGTAYGPTKAALHNLAEAIKPELDAHNIITTVVNPGFIKTDLTASNSFKMPQLLEVDDAAERMIKGLAKQTFEVIFPYPFAGIVKLLGDLPRGILFWLTRKIAKQT